MLHFPRWKITLIIFSCLFFVVLALPSLMPEKMRSKLPSWLAANSVSLGLDLQGGSQLLLEVDFDAYTKEQLATLVDDIRATFREQKIGYKNLTSSNGAAVFSLREADGGSL